LGSILVVVGFTLAIYLLLDVFEINDINPFFLLHLGFFALGSEVLGILFLSKIR
jgi:hypothetical protein